MKNVTLAELNENDNPRDFDGECVSDDGNSALWKFGDKFAVRTTTEGGEFFWDDEIDGWNPENYEMLTIN